MDEEKKSKKGVTSKGKVYDVKHRKHNPKLKHVSKEEFTRIRKNEDEAEKAAEEARRKSLAESAAESGDTPEEVEEKEQAIIDIGAIKAELKKTRKALEKTPGSGKLKKKLAELEEQLNVAEDALEEKEEAEDSDDEE